METWSPDEARRFLLAHHGLGRPERAKGVRGIRRVLERLRVIQLDPLDPMGTNADLVVMARVDGASRGDVYQALAAPHAFEHFAKERCLIRGEAFPYYRERGIETPWWRVTERARRVPEAVVESVFEEVARRGPIGARELEDRGAVQALDWSGWKGTSRMATMALEILWTRCRIVTVGRDESGQKRFDLPERAGLWSRDQAAPEVPFERWAIDERVRAAGMLARAGGPTWSTVREARRSTLPDELIHEGSLREVQVTGSRRTYLVPANARAPREAPDDGRLRILAPLDPMIWDRKLVSHAFGFDYVWEVYKPASVRRFGWYVCPLLHHGRLVGRLEGRVADGALHVVSVYREPDATLDPVALREALEHHAARCGATRVVGAGRRPKVRG